MAIEKKLIHFGKLADFETQLTAGNILDRSIVFIQDAKKIWTHGTYYDCSESVSPDADNVYITDFTVNDLENIIGSGLDVVADLTSLEEALAAHKVILVPYNADDGYLGYGFLTGYAEDLLYCTVYVGFDGLFYVIEATRGDTAIRGQSIFKRTWSDKQDKLVSGTNIKTINGESIIGSGNITISGGSSSGGSGAYSEVNHGTSDTTFTLTPNTFHVWDEVASLTLDFGSETSGVANEFLFQFTSGSTATSLTLPDDIKWTEELVIEANRIYQVSILKGLASVLSWENTTDIQLVRFTVDGVPYNAEDGMTWEVWCKSPYNTGGFSIIFPNVQDKNGNYVYSDTNGSYVYYNNPIYINSYTTVHGPTGGE